MEEKGQLKRTVIDTTAGLIAGGISRTVTSPLDVIKIRFQVRESFEIFAFIFICNGVRLRNCVDIVVKFVNFCNF